MRVVADTAELVLWVLSFGLGLRVVGPAELHEKVQREAASVACQ